MLEIIAAVATILAIAIAAVLILAATKPNNLRVERAVTVNARAETIFPLITDLREWKAWSPYETKDPAMKRTYGGAESGKGAIYAWDGNSNVGTGRMEITEAMRRQRSHQARFHHAVRGHNTAEFTLVPKDNPPT